MKRQTAWLIVALVLATACTSVQRVDKADVADQFYSFAYRAQAVSIQYQQAYSDGRLTDTQADEWNRFLMTMKAAFQRLAERLDLASTPKQLNEIRDALATMRVTLEDYARRLAI